ncbi:dickkopf-related protein 4-like [Amia ocellicauda]|uniref:dickkopf-related protein 4-like n=1 Tax=Amia ocellicauda TaxID=2972642 RepID=UPI00346456C3
MLCGMLCGAAVAAWLLCGAARCLTLDSNSIKTAGGQGSRGGQALRCQVDSECAQGQYCANPRGQDPVCRVCHPPRRRCHSNNMCCPGTLCINEVCTHLEVGPAASDAEVGAQQVNSTPTMPPPPTQGWTSPHTPVDRSTNPAEKGREGERCVRSSDCGEGLCCARHLWVKRCQRQPGEGEACTRQGLRKAPPSREAFQRCDCSLGLTCQPQPQAQPQAQDSPRERAQLWVCQQEEGQGRGEEEGGRVKGKEGGRKRKGKGKEKVKEGGKEKGKEGGKVKGKEKGERAGRGGKRETGRGKEVE